MRIKIATSLLARVRLEWHCRGASAERRSAVHAALRRVPPESRRGRHPESRADGRVRAERHRRVAGRRHDASARPSAVARRAHRHRRASHGPPRARRIPTRAARSLHREHAVRAERRHAMERLGSRHAQHAPSARCRRPHARERRQPEAAVGVRYRGRHAVALAARGRRRPLVHGQPIGRHLRARSEDRAARIGPTRPKPACARPSPWARSVPPTRRRAMRSISRTRKRAPMASTQRPARSSGFARSTTIAPRARPAHPRCTRAGCTS